MIKDWRNKKILILGLGREGLSTLGFLRKNFPGKTIGVADEDKKVKEKVKKISNVEFYSGKDYLKAIDSYEVIIRSPGIPLSIPALAKAKKQGKMISSQTKIFFDLCPGKIIGITGTKGKSTTSSLIYQILKKGGIKVDLIGNIGKPSLSYLDKADKKSIFVFELSSHQLVDLKKSPHIAVVLNIVPEHLDYYPCFEDYVKAKRPIVLYQQKNDYLVYNPSFEIPKKFSQLTKAQKIPFSAEKMIKLDKIPLEGKFNLQNIMAAVIVAKLFKISEQIINQVVADFKPLPHRLELIGTFKGIIFYNDSLATTPYATIAAIQTLSDKVATIFLGGHERNLDFSDLAKEILKSQIKYVILLPPNGKRIWQAIKKQAKDNLPQNFFVKNMEEGVKLAYQHTSKGRICLLSCAAPSFGLFKDYQDRGNQFKKWVRYYGKKRLG